MSEKVLQYHWHVYITKDKIYIRRKVCRVNPRYSHLDCHGPSWDTGEQAFEYVAAYLNEREMRRLYPPTPPRRKGPPGFDEFFPEPLVPGEGGCPCCGRRLVV